MDPCTCSAAERARDLSTFGQSVDIYVKQHQLLASIQTGSPFLVHLSELFFPAVVCCLWTTDIWSDPDLHYSDVPDVVALCLVQQLVPEDLHGAGAVTDEAGLHTQNQALDLAQSAGSENSKFWQYWDINNSRLGQRV